MKNILFIASEAVPFIKTGGLADVVGSLPKCFDKKYFDVRVMIPKYLCIKEVLRNEMTYIDHFYMDYLGQSRYVGILQYVYEGITFYFIDNESYFWGEKPYGDWYYDLEKFSFFSQAALSALPVIGWKPDIVHCHDWQTGLIPVYLKDRFRGGEFFRDMKTVMTIHNLKFQGVWDVKTIQRFSGLPDYYFTPDKLEAYKDGNMLKGGLVYADAITTVSSTYAEEIKTPFYGEGLDGLMRARANDLRGIVNGIDYDDFNPETDPALPAHYNSETFVEGKAAVKAALQKEVGLPVKPDVPLMVMVTRLAGHKGLDLLCYIARRLMWEEDAQLLILGTGEAQYESFFKDLANQFPDQVSAQITFNLGLAARIYAGGDIYLMPPKSEPCGLSQMNAMRYGTVPVVHATGGLKDTVPPADENGEGGLGFTFQSYNADDFFASLKRCLGLYNHNREAFRALQKRDMEKDFSWDVPAGRYMEQFRNMLSW